MRGATECAKRLKLYLSTLRSKHGKVGHLPASDPITQLLLGVLTRDVPESKAAEGLERLRGMVVDYNELRVIPAIELADVLSDFPEARLKCEDISRALNRIFAREHVVALDGLREMSKRDAAAYLDEIDGLEPYTRARIRLLGLGQHAIPLDVAMWALARKEEIVYPKADLNEAQQFLERRLAEDEGLEFVSLLKKQAWAEMATAVRKGEVEPIRSVPPDRTSRNMLAALAASSRGESEPSGPDIDIDDESDDADADAGETAAKPAPGRPRRSTRKSRSTSREGAAKKSASPEKKASRGDGAKAAAKSASRASRRKKSTSSKTGKATRRKAKSA